MNIVTLSYDSTDIGWAGTLPKLLHLLKQRQINPKEIKYLVVTHFHPDHAGLAQDLKGLGATLVVHACQVPS